MAVEVRPHTPYTPYTQFRPDLAFGRPPLEGRRTPANSPEYFPGLGIPGCQFLHEVATVTRFFEIHLLRSAPRHHIPSSIQSLVDVSEALIQRKDSESVIFPPSHSLRSSRLTTKPQNKTTVDIDPYEIETLEMIFASNGKSADGGEVKICLRPNTGRVYNEPGSGFLEGMPKDEARGVLSSRRRSAEDVAQILDSYEETPAAFSMISDDAELEIIFSEKGQAIIATSMDNGKEPRVTNGLAICRLSTAAKVTEISFPLSYFCGTKVPSSQEKIEQWLGQITLDLANKATW